MNASILLIEGKRSDHTSFSAGLQRKGFAVLSAPNGSAALAHLPDVDPDLVVVDAASLRTSGKRICQALRRELDGLPIVLITDNAHACGEPAEADVTLVLPFTIQKLVNRLKPLLPVEDKNTIHLGPIRLDVQERRVRCLGKQSRLTPRLLSILQHLMDRKGEVVDRNDLFRQVWATQYVADTRTLDVHISWLRDALEADPRHPRFLKTVRGVGYKLEV